MSDLKIIIKYIISVDLFFGSIDKKRYQSVLENSVVLDATSARHLFHLQQVKLYSDSFFLDLKCGDNLLKIINRIQQNLESARTEDTEEAKTVTNDHECPNTERLQEEANLKIPPMEKEEADSKDFLLDLLMSKSFKNADLKNEKQQKPETFDDDVVESASQVSGPVSG